MVSSSSFLSALLIIALCTHLATARLGITNEVRNLADGKNELDFIDSSVYYDADDDYYLNRWGDDDDEFIWTLGNTHEEKMAAVKTVTIINKPSANVSTE